VWTVNRGRVSVRRRDPGRDGQRRPIGTGLGKPTPAGKHGHRSDDREASLPLVCNLPLSLQVDLSQREHRLAGTAKVPPTTKAKNT
jgi:hypothetical protein